MALIIKGETQCALCGEVIQDSDETVGTLPFISDPRDKFYRFSDAPFHKRCFDAWKYREKFCAQYEEFLRNSNS